MACLLYSRTGIENSPYASLLDPVHWLDICDIFARDACALLGLSLESPLQVCVTAGCVALPSLLQIRQVMQQRQVTGVWTSKDELPVSEVCFLRTKSVTKPDGPCCFPPGSFVEEGIRLQIIFNIDIKGTGKRVHFTEVEFI